MSTSRGKFTDPSINHYCRRLYISDTCGSNHAPLLNRKPTSPVSIDLLSTKINMNNFLARISESTSKHSHKPVRPKLLAKLNKFYNDLNYTRATGNCKSYFGKGDVFQLILNSRKRSKSTNTLSRQNEFSDSGRLRSSFEHGNVNLQDNIQEYNERDVLEENCEDLFISNPSEWIIDRCHVEQELGVPYTPLDVNCDILDVGYAPVDDIFGYINYEDNIKSDSTDRMGFKNMFSSHLRTKKALFSNYMYDFDSDDSAVGTDSLHESNTTHLIEVLNAIDGDNNWSDVHDSQFDYTDCTNMTRNDLFIRRPSTIVEENSPVQSTTSPLLSRSSIASSGTFSSASVAASPAVVERTT